ncbi:hypothetical protein SCLCIDRAFT_1220961 [Scleroderma citrinum Foug A]|uniref:Uncharacterized protein n=1 Tax=Scleroderma citrinum Foug A TaxID=1036808 RepID=A0A0C2Z1S4_9AGAM|nr:hypothetical protein SCLCIDRAFT_1220961 [Scleroderma citrinum Foug A]
MCQLIVHMFDATYRGTMLLGPETSNTSNLAVVQHTCLHLNVACYWASGQSHDKYSAIASEESGSPCRPCKNPSQNPHDFQPWLTIFYSNHDGITQRGSHVVQRMVIRIVSQSAFDVATEWCCAMC